jgi:hypothetical protein
MHNVRKWLFGENAKFEDRISSSTLFPCSLLNLPFIDQPHVAKCTFIQKRKSIRMMKKNDLSCVLKGTHALAQFESHLKCIKVLKAT